MNWTRRALLGALTTLAMVAVVFAGGSPAQAGPYDHVGTAKVSGGFFYLTNDETGLCMEVANGSSIHGTVVRQNYCAVSWAQQFLLVSIGTVNGVQAWRLKPRFAQPQCLDVRDGVTVSGQQLQIWDCSNGWQQMFEMVDLPNGPTYHKYQLRPVYNHWCVNVHDLGPLANLVEQPCGHGTGHQDLWVLSY